MQSFFRGILCLTGLSRLAWGQLHFISLGNWGSGSGTQSIVANTLKNHAEKSAASLIISPGSNFLEGGVGGLKDHRWAAEFESIYNAPSLQIPFFTVLGEYDWAGNFTSEVLRSNEEYIKESCVFPRWTMPNYWYHYVMHFADSTSSNAAYNRPDVSVGFIFIDTNILSDEFNWANVTMKHWNDLRDTLATAKKILDWVIVVGDKTLLSSGSSKGDKYLQKSLLPLLKEHQVDAYISGQDFDMEALIDDDLSLINCGSASASDSLIRQKSKHSQKFASVPGFCRHTLLAEKFLTEFVDGRTGEVVGTYEKERNKKKKSVFDRYHLYAGLPEVIYIPIPYFPMIPVPVSDAFVKVVGTIGLVGTLFVICVALAAGIGRKLRR